MNKIVLEDFNEGDGYYKVNLAYLNKEQVEEIEVLVSKWNPTDEDIKACIGMCLTDASEQRFKDYGTNLKDCLAWLEKQKEYELTEEDKKIIPEALVMLCDDIINHRVHTPIKTDEEGARKIKAFLKTFNRQPHKTMKEWEKQKEQKPAEKQDYSGLNDLERAIHRGFLCAGVENVPVTTINETAKECLKQMKPAEWSEEDEKVFNGVIDTIKDTIAECDCDDVGTKARIIYEKELKWLETRLKSLRPQPKQEWSEEDEKEVAILEGYICSKDWSDRHIDRALGIVDELVNKVKSLRHQPKQEWSEEDEKTISDSCCWLAEYAGYLMDKNYGKASMLMGLVDKLKSLRP